MLHDGKPYIGIRNYAPDRGEWDRKEVIICPLPMGEEIDNAMGKHPDKERERRSIEYSGQGEAWTHNDKRMHSNRPGMQRRVVQEHMECLYKRRLRHDGSIVRHKAQG
jgi:hypothetical protein